MKISWSLAICRTGPLKPCEGHRIRSKFCHPFAATTLSPSALARLALGDPKKEVSQEIRRGTDAPDPCC